MIDFKKEKVSGIPKDKLTIYNDIYGFGLTEAEIKNTENSLLEISEFPEKTLTKICKIIHTENGFCALLVRHIKDEQASSRKYHTPDRGIVLAGANHIPVGAQEGDFLIDTQRDYYDAKPLFEKRFIFRYKPTIEQLNYTAYILKKWNKKTTESGPIIISSEKEFYEKMHQSPEVLDALLQPDRKGDNTNAVIHTLQTIKYIYDYFGLKLDEKIFVKRKYGGGLLAKYVSAVIDVNDVRNNQRLALVTTFFERNRINVYRYGSPYQYSHTFDSEEYDYEITAIVVDSSSVEYDYMDPGRLYLSRGFNNERAQFVLPAEAFFLEILPEELPETSAPLYRHVINSDDIVIINQDRLQSLIKKYDHLEVMKKKQEEVVKIKAAKINNKMKEFIESKDEKAHFNFNGVLFYKDRIEWEGQILKSSTVSSANVLLKVNNYYRNQSVVDFDLIADEFFKLAAKEKLTEMTVGSIDVKYEQRTTKGTRFYVNEHRINKDDVFDVLKRALCYQDSKQYDGYLEHVSHCSLTIYEYLCTGLRIHVSDEFLDDKLDLLIPLDRINHRTVIVANGKKFQVSNINKLLVTKNSRKLADVITRLSDPEIVKGITPLDIAPILEASVKEHANAIKKNNELINKMETMFNVKLENIDFPSGKKIRGYIVKGSWRQYAIDSSDGNCYTYPDGRRLCMIDKSVASIGEYTNTAKIASRMFALKNDKMVADKINTIKPGEEIGTENQT